MTSGAVTMCCQEFVELVTEFLEGALPERDRHRFEAHADACGHCHRYLHQMRTVVKILGHPAYESVPAKVMRAFRGRHA